MTQSDRRAPKRIITARAQSVLNQHCQANALSPEQVGEQVEDLTAMIQRTADYVDNADTEIFDCEVEIGRVRLLCQPNHTGDLTWRTID